MTNAELVTLLSHPDAFVRSLADWALRARRSMTNTVIAPYRIEDGLRARLEALAARGLVSSNAYRLGQS